MKAGFVVASAPAADGVFIDGPGDVVTIDDIAWVLTAGGSLVEVDAPVGVDPEFGPSVFDVPAHSTRRGLAVIDDTTLLVGAGSVSIVPLTGLESPYATGSFNADCGRGVVVGTVAYVACGRRSFVDEGVLGVVDVEDPLDLERRRELGELIVGDGVVDVDVVLAAPGVLAVLDSENDVHLVSIDNSTAPTPITTVDTA